MTIALLAALFAVIAACGWLMDRKDRRHDAHVQRLLAWQKDPVYAAQQETRSAEVLYLHPDDDHAWNEQHGRGGE